MKLAIHSLTTTVAPLKLSNFIPHAVNWCVSRWNGRDTMDVIFIFRITSWGINIWKGVNQLKELFSLNLFYFYVYLKLTNHSILSLKTHYFSRFITKMGFCCKGLSLNDLTPSPISRPGTHCLQWQQANARANLRWWHEPFPDETSIAQRPCARKTGWQKGLGDAWISFHPTIVVNLAW